MRFPIIKNRRIWYTISIILSVLSIASVFVFGLNLSLQFTGGIENTYSFKGPRPETHTLRDFVAEEAKAFNTTAPEGSKINIGTPVAVPVGDKQISVRYRIEDSQTSQTSYADFNVKLRQAVETKFGAHEDSSSAISPSVGNVMKTQAIWAMILASIAIIVYIAWGFRDLPKGLNPWVFGVNAILALFHDLIVMFGVFVVLGYFFQVEMGPFFITAILTILGFSVNDTIVIYDRIRENLQLTKGKTDIAEVAETSVWQTMARSFNTSFTVVITLTCLLFLGAEGIHTFVLALLIGVIVGTYSSIFLAAPLLVTFKKQLVRKGKK